MALIDPKTLPHEKMQYDLRGQAGNAFAVLGNAASWGRQMGMTKEQIDAILAEAKSSDYKHLIETINEHFGHIVDFILPDRW